MDDDLKYGVQSKAKSFEKKSRNDTNFGSSYGNDPLDKMMIIGKGLPLNKYRGINSSYRLHECHSDTAINPLNEGDQHKDSFPREGFSFGLSEQLSASSVSFASAKSDLSVSEAMHKKLCELEYELSEREAIISILRKQLNKDSGQNIDFSSVAVETDLVLGLDEDFQLKLNELQLKIGKQDKTIGDLSRELEETLKDKGKQVEENRNLSREAKLLNRQLQSMYELVQSKHWDTGIDPKEYADCRERLSELEDALAKKEESTVEMRAELEEREKALALKDKALADTRKKFWEYESGTTIEITRLIEKNAQLEKELHAKERNCTERISEAQKSMEDEIVAVTQKLEAQYQEDIRGAVERCRSSFKKLSEMPKTKIDNILKLSERGKLDIMILQKDWEDQKLALEKKINTLQEEKTKEISLLNEGYESKVAGLKSEIQSLNQQLKERKETLETFESELKMYRKEKAKSVETAKAYDVKELKHLHAVEIHSQQEKHMMETEILQEKIKRLSEEILSHANAEKIQLQELQSAKLMATTFREKYEQLLTEFEEKLSSKKVSDHIAMINQLDLEDSLSHFKDLIYSLKKAEEIHEGKIKFLKALDEKEKVIHQREMCLLEGKLEQVDRFQNRLMELDGEIKEMIGTVEMKYKDTIHALTSCYSSEVRLKQLEVDSKDEVSTNVAKEFEEKLKDLEKSNEILEKEKRAMKTELEEVTVELLRNEGVIAIKVEIEDTLTERIKQLESLIEMKNENSQKELENALSKCLAAETLLTAREEVVREYEDAILENERILERSDEQADHIENRCRKMKEAMMRVEDVYEAIVDANSCENYFLLKKKMDFLSIEFNEMCSKSKDLEEEYVRLSKTNLALTAEKKDMAKKYREIKMEKDKIFESYRLIESELNKVKERSRIFQCELDKMTRENKIIENKCNDIIRKNCCGDREVQGEDSDECRSLLDKISTIGALVKVEGEPREGRGKSEGDLKAAVGAPEERERMLREERDEIAASNSIIKDNIMILRERVDNLLMELASARATSFEPLGLVKVEQDVQILYCELDDPPKKDSSSDSVVISQVESSETIKYIMRCDALSRENHNLKRENDELKIELKAKEMGEGGDAEGRGEMGRSFREEMITKLENIQKEMWEVISEKDGLVRNFEVLLEERDRLREELEEMRNANCSMQNQFEAELRLLSEESSASLKHELTTKELKINEMKREMKKLTDCVKTLNHEMDMIRLDNQNLVSESCQHMENNQCLKDELKEAWSQKYEIEDQLTKLRRENAVLNMHRDHLEQTNKRISNLISEGTPSVVSWLKIHETVENIVDVVQTLKTSVNDLDLGNADGSGIPAPSKSNADAKALPDCLQLQLENKTKLCQELVTQKLMLERELENLENMMKSGGESEQGSAKDVASGRAKLTGGTLRHNSQAIPECIDEPPDYLPVEPNITITEEEMDGLKGEDEERYLATLHRLKKLFEVQVHLQEAQLTEALANEIEGLKKEILRLEEEVRAKDGALADMAESEKSEVESLKMKHKEEIKGINVEHEAELEKLREILKEVRETGNSSLLIHQIESMHAKQMEDLRRYFEKKCAELEKNYSEEVFSRQSIACEEAEEDGEDEEEDGVREEEDEIVERCRVILEAEEEDNAKKQKLMDCIVEIVNIHSEELNCIKSKHNKEIANLRKRYALEVGRLREELSRSRLSAEAEREALEKRFESREKEIAVEERRIVAAELEREFEMKVKVEIKKFSDLLLAEAKAQEERSLDLEETCMDELSVHHTESALKKIEAEKEMEARRKTKRDEDEFRRILMEEKLRIAQYYMQLNEESLKRFNEEQENLIKAHAEVMHRLVQEHEERILELKRAHKLELERLHCDGELKLANEFRNREKKFEEELTSIKSTYEDELFELKKCCQDTLNEQVSLAKADAFNCLQKQIQNYLEGDGERNTPKEVIELGEKFAGKYRREIEELKERHCGEVKRIRLEYEDKIRRRYSTGSLPKRSPEKMDMKTDDDKLQILRERDALQEMVASLRHVLSELIRYVGSCEDELNSTIVVGDFERSEATMYKSLQMNSTEIGDGDCSSFFTKKVHLAPDLSNIMNEMNDSRSLNTSMLVRVELDRCLKQLKSDASHLLALSNPSRRQDQNIYELLLKIEKDKDHLLEKVISLEEMHTDLKADINQTRGKLTELERARETVSEGFGEEVVSLERHKTLTQLREKAKALMSQQCNQTDVLNTLEEICKEGDRQQEEARREKNDLQQQVAAADKQLRSIRNFLEEQAAERELERDEYTSEIKRLKEVLRVKERDKTAQDRVNQEVESAAERKLMKIETLESQLREANGQLLEVQQGKTDAENQLKEAVDKIWTLREIIRELEGQVLSLGEGESALKSKVRDLESANEEQTRINQNLLVELEALKTTARDEYEEHIRNLEEELSVFRRAAERLAPEALSQMREKLREIDVVITKKTKDLEHLHGSSLNPSCSSPSEDISICERLDKSECPTPVEMRDADDDGEKIGLPVDEVDRILEKLVRHARAEEVAIKTVRDLEAQLRSNRKALEEIQIERDVLLERVDSYLQENSRLKVRLDEQRCNAGLVQRQLSADLEAQIKRLESDIEKLSDLCVQKDKQIRDMGGILEQTTKSLKIREAEALSKSHEESEVVTSLRAELRATVEEKRKLEETVEKMRETIRERVTVPLLVDSMLEEKNAEIDRLEKEVLRLSRNRAASSFVERSDSTTDSTKRVKFTEPDSFVQFVSPILTDEPSVGRCASQDSYADFVISAQKLSLVNSMPKPESLSSIGPLQLSPRGNASVMQWSRNNFPPVPSPGEKEKELEVLNQSLEALRQQLSEKKKEIKRYESELSERGNVDAEINEIRVQLKATMEAVERDKSAHKMDFERMLESEEKLRKELDSRKREVSELLLEVDTLKRKLAESSLELETVKSERERAESELATRDDVIRRKESAVESLMLTMETLRKNHVEEVEELQGKLTFEHDRVEKVLGELKILEVKKVEIEEEFLSLKEDYEERLASEHETAVKLRAEAEELRCRYKESNEECEKLRSEMDEALAGAHKLSTELTEELSAMKSENEGLRADYLNLKSELDNCLARTRDRKDAECQAKGEEATLKKAEPSEEASQLQGSVDKLRAEMQVWEQKMDSGKLEKDEAMSYAVLVRTLIACILEKLDDHFYELQTYRRKVMECSVDDLADRVQKELLLSAKLDNKLLSNFQAESGSAVVDSGAGGDNNLSAAGAGKAGGDRNLVKLTVKLYELESNLQEMEQRNKEFEAQLSALKTEKEEISKRAEGLQKLVKALEEQVARGKVKLAEEKNRSDGDAKIMEVLRVNLEMFVEKVDELERQLRTEKKLRMSLEKQAKAAREAIVPDSTTAAAAVAEASEAKCQLEIEKQRSSALEASLEKERRKVQEVKLQLEQERTEKLMEKDAQRMLNKELILLQEQKANLEAQLMLSREMLQTRQCEVAALKKKINLQELDIKALSISTENQEERDAEMSIMAEKIEILQEEIDSYRERMQALTEKSKSISAPLLRKMTILSNCVQQHVQESNEMGEAFLNLSQETEEMRNLVRRIEETAENTAGIGSSNSSEDTILAADAFESERNAWAKERERLESELKKSRSDYEVLKMDSAELMKNNDQLKLEVKKLQKEVETARQESANQKVVGMPEDRALHLFGKYMRTESFRKALAFQKLYLKKVITGYEDLDEELWMRFALRKDMKKRHHGRPKRKSFKVYCLIIVAIKRMQFMVARWNMGRLSGFNALMGRSETAPLVRHPAPNLNEGPIDPLRYQTQYFLRPERNPSTRTPPSRARPLPEVRKVTDNHHKCCHKHRSERPSSRPP